MYLEKEFLCVKGYAYDDCNGVFQNDFTSLHTHHQWLRIQLLPSVVAELSGFLILTI